MQTKLLHKEEVAEGTYLFQFERPESFSYSAGQSIDLTLLNPKETDAEGNLRTYSLCSAPQEPHLAIATRMRDTAFKRTLGSLSLGSEMSLEGPFGSFFLHENATRPAVFLAGGIGITPFRSIILDTMARTLPHRLFLFYSNRQPKDAPFLSELEAVAAKNPQLTLVATMTSESLEAPWEGERGYIDGAMLEKRVPRDPSPVYYLAGPVPMVAAMRQLLVSLGVSNDDIRFEEFTGY